MRFFKQVHEKIAASYLLRCNRPQIKFVERLSELIKNPSAFVYFTKITPATWSINKITPVSRALNYVTKLMLTSNCCVSNTSLFRYKTVINHLTVIYQRKNSENYVQNSDNSCLYWHNFNQS